MAEWARPNVIAIGETCVLPRSVVTHRVMVATKWGEVVVVGMTSPRVRAPMIEVTVVGGHPTTWGNTGRVAGVSLASLGNGRPIPGRSRGEDVAFVDNRPGPLAVDLLE